MSGPEMLIAALEAIGTDCTRNFYPKHDGQTSAAWLAAFVVVILESEYGVEIEDGKVKAA